MYIKLYSAHLVGIEGQIVEIEVDIAYGLPHFDIVGLPGSALKESKERVRSAIRNSGYSFPNKRITVNMAPADLRKEGAYFDLVIALAILLADEQISLGKKEYSRLLKMLFIGELALDGSVRKSTGLLPLLLSAKREGFNHIFLPADNEYETEAIKGVRTIPIEHLKELIECMTDPQMLDLIQHKGKNPAVQMDRYHRAVPNIRSPGEGQGEKSDEEKLEDIHGQEHVKRAFEVAALGFHHLLLVGPPGSGKTMFAKRMISLLPALTEEERLEVAKIQSVAGLWSDPYENWGIRMFRAPHHTVTATGMMGGGTPVKPGEVSIAHLGILFLDEFLEFKREVIEALREPLEERQVTITRNQQRLTFPAHFLLVLALNPCPCGYYGYETERHPCTCTATQIERYRSKLSGPLYDRIDLHIDVPMIQYADLVQTRPEKDSSFTTEKIKERISRGLSFKLERGGSGKANGLLNPQEIKAECIVTKQGQELLKAAFEQLQLSARGYHKILKVARTIADLNETEWIDDQAIAEAIQYRSLDRR